MSKIIKKATKKLFSLEGILFLITRYGNTAARRLALDGYYESGKWDYLEATHSKDVVQTVERYINKGALLDMGCGTGVVSTLLSPGSYSSYLGIDASEEAIRRAKQRSGDNVKFKINDFLETDFGEDIFDVILFEESLYYLPSGRMDFCRKLRKHLAPEGVFIVTISNPIRYRSIITGIRDGFKIFEDRELGKSQRILLVFK